MTQDFAAALQAARTSDPEAMQSLAEQHLPLVRTLAWRFPSHLPKEELIQQGVIGLMKALQRFDPSRGTAFSTYAAPLILGEMRWLHRQQSPVHLPRTERALRLRIRQAEARLTTELHREPTVSELADALALDAAELMLHMDQITVTSTDAEENAAILPDPEDWQQRIELRDILSRLPDKDQQLILLRHRAGFTQQQAGQRLGMTQMQVSRREKIIRDLLRRALAGS